VGIVSPKQKMMPSIFLMDLTQMLGSILRDLAPWEPRGGFFLLVIKEREGGDPIFGGDFFFSL